MTGVGAATTAIPRTITDSIVTEIAPWSGDPVGTTVSPLTTPTPLDAVDATSTSNALPIDGAADDVQLVRGALRAARTVELGKQVIDQAREGAVSITVMPSNLYDARNGANTLAVARTTYTTRDRGRTRNNVTTVIEVDAGSFRRATKPEQAMTLVHELQHAVDARDATITNARSEANAYTVGDKVQTALGQRPGREAISRHDRTGELLSKDEIEEAVCKDRTYIFSYLSQGVWSENCAKFEPKTS